MGMRLSVHGIPMRGGLCIPARVVWLVVEAAAGVWEF